MKFSDGMEFNTSGPLRATLKSDGWYVVGNGMLFAVNTLEDAEIFIKKFSENKISCKEEK